MDNPASFARGLYVDTRAVVDAPDHVRRLVHDHGVQVFVVRTGFDPGAVTPCLDEAVAVLRGLSARIVFLVGTWWGEGLEPASGLGMRPARQVSGFRPGPAHEAKWPMLAPGPETCAAVHARIDELCRRHAPEGVCLTHARFHHAADIAGLLETGATPSFVAAMAAAGLTSEKLEQAFVAAERRLAGLETAAILAQAGACAELGAFLDALAGGDVFTRWFDLRCRVVTGAVDGLLAPLRAAFPQTRFGSNAIGPLFSRASGQDYAALAGKLDFIQPLLGYVEWHVRQSVRQWARWLRHAAPRLAEASALHAAGALFGLGETESARIGEPPEGEGSPELVAGIVRRQIAACERIGGFPRLAIQPVLRGKDWPAEFTAEAEAGLRAGGFGGAFYQGSAFLGGPPPNPDWN